MKTKCYGGIAVRLLLVVAAFACLRACVVEDYSFDNPFDGSGDPYALKAVSKPGFVKLSWSAIKGVDFDGYAVFRADNAGGAAETMEAYLVLGKDETQVTDKEIGHDGEKLYYTVSVYRGSVGAGQPERSKVAEAKAQLDSDGDGIADSVDPDPTHWICVKEADCPAGKRCSVETIVPGGSLVGVCRDDAGARHSFGGYCSENKQCKSNLCYPPNKSCLALCTHGTSDCPADGFCAEYGDIKACVEQCSDGGDCAQGLTCVFTVDSTVSHMYAYCGVPVGSKSFPDSCSSNSQCASGACGGGYCLKPCKGNYDCPGGAICVEWTTGVESKEVAFMACFQDICTSLGFVGECDGNFVKWCEDGEYHEIDCSQGGAQCVCGFKKDAGFYDCVGQCG